MFYLLPQYYLWYIAFNIFLLKYIICVHYAYDDDHSNYIHPYYMNSSLL